MRHIDRGTFVGGDTRICRHRAAADRLACERSLLVVRQGCAELGLPGYPPYGPDSANLNLILRQTPADPISGSSPLRASLCEIERIEAPDASEEYAQPA